VLRKQVSDCQTIQSENENLVKIVREMKKSLGSSLDPQTQTSPALSAADATERHALEEEKNILKQIRQNCLLIVDKDAFRELPSLPPSQSRPSHASFAPCRTYLETGRDAREIPSLGLPTCHLV
jgi:cell division septum initiation protein DivIVA